MPRRRTEAPERPEEEAPHPEGPFNRSTIEEAGAGLLRAVTDALGVAVERGRSELDHAARYGRVQLEVIRLRRERDNLFLALGKEVLPLLEDGRIHHPDLWATATRIREVKARLARVEEERVAAGEPSVPEEHGVEEPPPEQQKRQ
ncbi:MAG: hypothetical protein JXB39_06420 [Deltaproteobacteria bacterium]|nr:hypothetical protein [Deltaproteobacteria bacterium]